ncbi:uncharacterized protein LOC128232621 [Mya arenaria]|uniref:uncharacterized protein LOC128232621 n=1 Tax=Mya arenaria TaxID=6604 RepID=UPI0022E9795A|nr:uncharacterized protein LOC128232621 [Mya arenaria]
MGIFCFLWVFSLSVFNYLLAAEDGPRDCSPNDELPCLLYTFSGNGCSPDKLLQQFGNQYLTNSLNVPGSVSNISAKAQYKFTNDGKKYSEINLTITPPGNMHNPGAVQGFQVVRYLTSNRLLKCDIMILQNYSWTENNLQTPFMLSYFPSPDDVDFQVYTLPMHENRDKFDFFRTLSVSMPGSSSSKMARDWIASVYVRGLQEIGAIEVEIISPPAQYNFTEFTYTLLVPVGTLNIVKQRNQSDKYLHTFSNVTSGTYKVTVKPYDPYFLDGDQDKCLCEDCVPCTTTTTSAFNFTFTGPTCKIEPQEDLQLQFCKATTTTTVVQHSVSKSSPTAEPVTSLITTPRSTEGWKVGLGVMAAILAVIGVAAAVAIFIYRHRCLRADDNAITKQEEGVATNTPKQKDNRGFMDDTGSIFTDKLTILPNNNNVVEKVQLKKRPKLFLLYEDENRFHRNVVTSFATYLQQHCYCTVMCAEWELDDHWVHQDLQDADFAIIVNSEGAFKAYNDKYGIDDGYSGTPPGSRKMSSINSLKNKFKHDERYDNIVMVYFKYTDEKFIIPDICPGYTYKLMKNFTDFLLHIHQLHRTDNLAQYDLPLDGNHRLKPIGQQLNAAIAEALAYEQNKPTKPKPIYDRIDSSGSRFDSGLPQDFGSPGQTPVSDKPDAWSHAGFQDRLIAMLNPDDAITITPSDVGLCIENGHVYEKVENGSDQSAQVYAKLKAGTQKSRPSLNIPPPQNPDQDHPGTQSASSDPIDHDFEFILPDDIDGFDVVSKTISEQMQHIVDRYDTDQNDQNDPSGARGRNQDLLLLQAHCKNGEVISLGGESV